MSVVIFSLCWLLFYLKIAAKIRLFCCLLSPCLQLHFKHIELPVSQLSWGQCSVIVLTASWATEPNKQMWTKRESGWLGGQVRLESDMVLSPPPRWLAHSEGNKLQCNYLYWAVAATAQCQGTVAVAQLKGKGPKCQTSPLLRTLEKVTYHQLTFCVGSPGTQLKI